KINGNLGWKFWKSVTGTTKIVLPESFEELNIKITAANFAYVYHILRKHLTTSDENFLQGFDNGNTNYCNVIITKTNLQPGSFLANGVDYTRSSACSVYYR
ncbi:hypothetical protein, partial [Parablautia muri]